MCLRCTDERVVDFSQKHAGMSKLFWQLSLSSFCLLCIARSKAMPNSGCLRYKSFYIWFQKWLRSFAFFIQHFLPACSCYFCAALGAKIKFRKSDVDSIYSVYTRDKEYVSCALGCFCYLQQQDRVPSRQLQVVRAEVVVDLQILWP